MEPDLSPIGATRTDAQYESLMREMRRRLRHSLPRIPQDVIDASLIDALVKLWERPELYDETRGPLINWLTKVAINRARDMIRSESRRRKHETLAGIHFRDQGVNRCAIGADDKERWIAEYRQRLLSFARNDSERAFVYARLAGEPWVVQAAALGVPVLPKVLMQRQLSRVWDLLCHRARWATRHDRRPMHCSVRKVHSPKGGACDVSRSDRNVRGQKRSRDV